MSNGYHVVQHDYLIVLKKQLNIVFLIFSLFRNITKITVYIKMSTSPNFYSHLEKNGNFQCHHWTFSPKNITKTCHCFFLYLQIHLIDNALHLKKMQFETGENCPSHTLLFLIQYPIRFYMFRFVVKIQSKFES